MNTNTAPLESTQSLLLVSTEPCLPAQVLTEMQTLLALMATCQGKQLALLNQQIASLQELEQQALIADEKMKAKQVILTQTAEQFKTLADLLAHYQDQFHTLAQTSL